MSLSEIERQLMQADTGDSAVLHEMLIKLLEVVRGQQYQGDALYALLGEYDKLQRRIRNFERAMQRIQKLPVSE